MLVSVRIVIIALVSLVIGLSVLAGLTLRGEAESRAIAHASAVHGALARGYVNGVWSLHAPEVLPILETMQPELLAKPEIIAFAKATKNYFNKMPALRVNIYNDAGLLLMTLNGEGANILPENIPSPNSAMIGAMRAQVVEKNTVVAFRASGGQRMLLQSWVPLASAGASQSHGGVELISDITRPWEEAVWVQWGVVAAVIALSVLFAISWFFTSRRVESVLSRQHEENLELEKEAATAKAESVAKSQFLANISHELRTPLNAIIGFSNVLKNEALAFLEDKRFHEYINDINSSGVHLLSLINDILDYSKAEAGKLEIEISEVNVNKLVQNTLRMVEPRASAANVRLVDALPRETCVMVIDGKKLKQILLNLLSNAVKFTKDGGEVRVSLWNNVAEDTFTFEVRDSGIGIAPKDISRAMSAFGQVDNSNSRKYEGTGLGLPLTKKFVDLMGGKFTIESKVDIGTTITFTLPREVKAREGIIIKQLA